MRAGKLDRIITIERATHAIDANGVATSSWSPLVTLRAAIVKNATTEQMRDRGATTEARITFHAWWRPGITVADRVAFDGAHFSIVGLEEIGRRRELEITVERIGA